MPDAVVAFQGFVQGLINDWNFTTICVAHKANPTCTPNAKKALITLQKVATVCFLTELTLLNSSLIEDFEFRSDLHLFNFFSNLF